MRERWRHRGTRLALDRRGGARLRGDVAAEDGADAGAGALDWLELGAGALHWSPAERGRNLSILFDSVYIGDAQSMLRVRSRLASVQGAC